MDTNHNKPRKATDLPFEILGLVFTYYVEEETLFHSLETLLSVSWWWNLVALGHQALWGKLRIHLGHKPTQDAWRVILPRRLERAGSAPLSIEIKYALEGIDHPYYERVPTCTWQERDFAGINTCSCIQNAPGCAQDLLELLTGPDGEFCKRWIKLHLALGGEYEYYCSYGYKWASSRLLCHPLTHPMPLIESIHLEKLDIPHSISKPLFSSTPSVRIVHFDQCALSLGGANFSSAESIILRSIIIRKGASHLLNFPLSMAIRVLDFDRSQVILPKIGRALPNLHTLHLGEHTNHLAVPNPDFPSLKNLKIEVLGKYDTQPTIFLDNLVSSRHHPLSSVEFLTFSRNHSSERSSRRLASILKPFLDELESIKHIVGPREVLAIIIKYILAANEQREGSHLWNNMFNRALKLEHSTSGSVAHLVFDDTMKETDICSACKTLDIPDPRAPWEQYFRGLHPIYTQS